MFQDFLGSVLVRGEFLGVLLCTGKTSQTNLIFLRFPPCPPKKRGTLEQNFFLLCNQGLTSVFLFHEVGTKWNLVWNKVLAWGAVCHLE